VSISGGVGSVAGAVLGALFLGVIKNALPVVGVSPFWQMSISGAIIIAAVILNTRAERAKGRIILRRLDAGREAGA
jgi:rhamnose transport system permease protein